MPVKNNEAYIQSHEAYPWFYHWICSFIPENVLSKYSGRCDRFDLPP